MKRVLAFGALALMVTATPSAAQPVAEKAFDKLTNKVTWGGYYEFEYEDVERIDGSNGEADFDQHRFILFVGAQPHERIKLFGELEFEHGGNANDLKFEQAWLEFALTDNHNFRGGVDLIPVGRMNINHDGNLRDFVFRPEVDQRLIPTTWYEAGVWLNGDLIPDHLGYTIGISNGLRESTSVGGQSEIRSMRRTTALNENDNNDNKAVSGRLSINPTLATEIGLSGYHGQYQNNNTLNGDSDITLFAVDLSHVWRQFEIRGEYVWVDKDQQAGSTQALTGADGGYVELAYHFFPEFLRDSLIARGFDNPVFTLIGRAETLDFDNPGNQDINDKNVYSIGLNYRPIEQMAFKVSYDFVDQKGPGVQSADRFGAGLVLGF